MDAGSWTMVGLAAVLPVGLALWIVSTRRIGPLLQEQRVRFVCPEKGEPVDCLLVQDIRTGQWKGLRACTALEGGAGCEVDCAKLLNLGFKLRPVGGPAA